MSARLYSLPSSGSIFLRATGLQEYRQYSSTSACEKFFLYLSRSCFKVYSLPSSGSILLSRGAPFFAEAAAGNTRCGVDAPSRTQDHQIPTAEPPAEKVR